MGTMTDPAEQRIARHLSETFGQFYGTFLDIPRQAKIAFEKRNHPESLRLSSLRLRLYSDSIARESEAVAGQFPQVRQDEARWTAVERLFRTLTEGVYHEDLALAYLHSVRRKIYRSEWRVEDYSSYQLRTLDAGERDKCYLEIPLTGDIQPAMVR